MPILTGGPLLQVEGLPFARFAFADVETLCRSVVLEVEGVFEGHERSLLEFHLGRDGPGFRSVDLFVALLLAAGVSRGLQTEFGVLRPNGGQTFGQFALLERPAFDVVGECLFVNGGADGHFRFGIGRRFGFGLGVRRGLGLRFGFRFRIGSGRCADGRERHVVKEDSAFRFLLVHDKYVDRSILVQGELEGELLPLVVVDFELLAVVVAFHAGCSGGVPTAADHSLTCRFGIERKGVIAGLELERIAVVARILSVFAFALVLYFERLSAAAFCGFLHRGIRGASFATFLPLCGGTAVPAFEVAVLHEVVLSSSRETGGQEHCDRE